MKNILLTGVAGFIGSKVGELLLKKGFTVIGVDELNDYYDVRLKEWRLENLKREDNFLFYKEDISDYDKMEKIFQKHKIDVIINLAARAGVRYSFVKPLLYYKSNVTGNVVLLELAVKHGVEKFILSSSSSVYAGQEMPFNEEKTVDFPISPYAASKRNAEISAYAYYKAYKLNVTVFRYFTVYGPASRPDMAIYRFAKWINEGTPLLVYGDGSQIRSFTYVDDIAEGTVKALDLSEGFEIINLGNDKTNSLMDVIKFMEKFLNKKAVLEFKPFHKGDMKGTWADITKAEKLLHWSPVINLEKGIEKTVKWTLENIKLVNSIPIDIKI